MEKNLTATAFKGRNRLSRRSWWAAPVAFLVAMLTAPASAHIDIPDDPLTTAARVAPNILFILDDSGSMNFIAMPKSAKDTADPTSYGNVQIGLSDNPTDRSYLNNTIYYNPSITYLPWMLADGTRMQGGTSVASVFAHWSLVGPNTLTRNLIDSPESVFYVPKPGVSSSTDPDDFIRYSIQNVGGVARVVRHSNGSSGEGDSWREAIPPSQWRFFTFDVVSGTSLLRVRTSGGRNGNADLYIRYGQQPTADCGRRSCGYDAKSDGSGNSESVDLENPRAGTWYIGIYNRGGSTVPQLDIHVDTVSGPQEATPTGRTQEAELVNIATWYSYHRTRMKAAKAGSSEAFGALDGKVRVGFRTLWNRNDIAFDIPVNDGNDGRFVDHQPEGGGAGTASRSTWFSRLHGITGLGSTPLHGALEQAGEYFRDESSSGPYGPQVGTQQYSCRQNFAILTTDGYWNDDTNYSGSMARNRWGSVTSPISWTGGVGNQDGAPGSEITGPNRQSYTYVPRAPYVGSASNTLADVAMKYWKTDLRPTLTNNVPTTQANRAFWQHMVTFGISIGLSGTRGWRSVAEVPDNATWPDPNDREDSDRIDDLLHAAVNSRGEFVAASNPTEFTNGLAAALAAISQRTGSFSGVSADSVSLDAGTRVFNASYVSGVWSGALSARSAINGEVMWEASIPGILQRRNRVFTHSGGGGALFPTNAQAESLARDGGPANYEVSGEANARYLMGDTSLEERNGTGRLRNRLSLLGDIVHSSPAFVRETDTVYVGANDGMLHAFDASSGEELFAYVPGIIDFSSLSTLSRPDYSHKYFVDGPVVVSPRSLTVDANILVGSLGRGGKGLFALDVTNPGSFSASDVKWEVSETSDGNMGLVLGKPVLARVATGKNAVLVPNGVNSESGSAVLIVLDLETGDVIQEIDTGVGSADVPNGLSSPTAVFGPDGRTVAYVYAGDMLGNVWKFDLTDVQPSQWDSSRLFTAVDEDDRAQPITSAVAVATNPRTLQRWVFFGTGRYLTAEDADPLQATTQSMYGFVEPTGDEAWTRDDLVERTISVTGVHDGFQVRGFEERASVPDDKEGWYIDLPGDGERIVQDAQVASGYLVTASMMPTGDACEAGGTGFINALDAFTGTSGGSSYFDLDHNGSTADEVIEDVPIGSYNPGVGMPTLPGLLRGRLVTGGSGTGEVSGVATLRPRWDRVSWREIRGD